MLNNRMTLIIADNQDITKAGIKYLSTTSVHFEEIMEVKNRKELVNLLIASSDAVVLLDYTLFDLSTDYLLILQERFKHAHWLLFCENLSEDFIRRVVICNKAFSIVMKDAPLSEIQDALRHAKRCEQYICSSLTHLLSQKEVVTDDKTSPLTATEREILKCIAQGKSTKEIAAERFLSVHTVMTHRKNIFRKLGVNNVHEATKYALRAGIINTVEYYI